MIFDDSELLHYINRGLHSLLTTCEICERYNNTRRPVLESTLDLDVAWFFAVVDSKYATTFPELRRFTKPA